MRNALLLAALVCCACSDTGDVCSDGAADIGSYCLPEPMAPGNIAIIQLRELCGRGCSDPPTCTALFRNSQVVLDVGHTTCNSQLTAACESLGCLERIIPCTLPELSAGDYPLVVPGAPLQLLHVASGGQSGCRLRLPDGGVQ
ncbi:MAG TPA: hypothetical protein VH083_28225 [Myxococcales bacterium]|nr:hypothetical protein [Myxococcales bacterium]